MIYSLYVLVMWITYSHYLIEIQMLKIILILVICSHCTLAADQCSQFDTLTQDQIWQVIRPIDFQNYFVISLGSLSLVCLIITILTWRIYRSFSVPSDIMFAICWAQLIQNSSLVASSIYFLAHPQNKLPPDFPIDCTVVSIIYTIGNTSSLIYNVVFCLVLSISIRKTLKGSLFSQVRYHIMIIVSVTAITLGLALSQVTSSGFSGVCGYKLQNRQSFARFVGDLAVVAVCLYSMYMFKARVPKNSYFKKVSVFGYYFYYMGFFSIIQILSSTGYLLGNISCMLNASIANSMVKITITFGAIQSIILSFVLMGLRFSHPLLKMKIRKLLNKRRNQFDPEEESINDRPWLGSLLQSIKGSQMISMLSGVIISFAEHQFKIKMPQNISNFSYKRNYKLEITQDITDQYIVRRISNSQNMIVKQKLQGMRPLNYNVTAYCIQVFCSLMSNQDANIFRSFDLSQNLSLVKQKSYTNGGKSGQFFFCTYDHQFLIKTVTQDEAELYLQKIKYFFQYFQKNPYTMIAKILGLYKFQRSDVEDQPIYIILMRNVSPYDRAFQERIYDIKGSQFNRSTISQKKIKIQNHPDKLRNHTLKDQDFKRLEQKICIDPEKSRQLKIQLKGDANFLGSMQVLDYSILIIKRKGIMRQRGEDQIKYRFNQFPSYAARDQYYNIGIIDYLQSWTLKRKAQRAFKTMITNKKVTVTSPQEYSKRLVQFIDQII